MFSPARLFAAETPPSIAPDDGSAAAEPTRQERLDTLFKTLATATDDTVASAAEDEITRIWMQSGSDTVDLLMEWTMQAMDDKNYALALDFLDRVVIMKPDYAEGWNKRATTYFLLDDYAKSLSDIARVLALEPRHFGALSGLGAIFSAMGDDKRAIVAYRQALDLDPMLDNVRQSLDDLEKQDAGEGI